MQLAARTCACASDAPPVSLSTASLEDLDFVVAFNIASARDQGQPELVRETVEKSVRTTLGDLKNGPAGRPFYLLAWLEDRPIGQLRIQPSRYDWSGREVWEVQHVYVEPAYRSRGVCRSLVREATRRASLHGASKLYLHVTRGNEAARRAYEKGGFKHQHYDLMVLDLG